MTSTMNDPNKPVTGYPPPPGGYHPAQPSYIPNSYPSAHPSTATAYPYTAPPPATYYNTTPYQSYDPRRTTFLRRMIIAGIAVFLIIGAITFIIWLVIRPHLPQFRVNSVSVTRFNASASQITANWEVDFSVRNPNKKMSIFYDHIGAVVLYREEFLSETALPPFYQGKKNETTIQSRFAADSAYLNDRKVTILNLDRSRGVVNFSVRMAATVRFRAGSWRMRKHVMRVYCEDVKVGFSSNAGEGKLVGGSNECEVNL